MPPHMNKQDWTEIQNLLGSLAITFLHSSYSLGTIHSPQTENHCKAIAFEENRGMFQIVLHPEIVSAFLTSTESIKPLLLQPQWALCS